MHTLIAMKTQINKELIDLLFANHEGEYDFMPSRKVIEKWYQDLFGLFFPEYLLPRRDIEWQLRKNQDLLLYIISKILKDDKRANEQTDRFYNALAEIYKNLNADATDIFNNDPAANCLSEVINSYPGFYAICAYRVAHYFEKELKLPLVPRILTEYAHHKTGVDIHPGAEIDVPFFIDHGTGVVIGETCVIGKNVKVYQGVTLGALQVSKSMAEQKRHPTIEDNVVIYANATILGGSTVVGNNSVIGGNVFLTESVNPYSTVFHTNEISIKNRSSKTEVINFII